MTSALINHLWQSTLFASAAGLLAFVLRKNRAQARYWIWLIASLKFLVPFSLIVALGSLLAPSTTVPAIQPEFSAVVNEVSQPFTVPAVSIPAARSSADPLPTVLFAIWFFGFAIILFGWCARWLRVRSVIRTAHPLLLPSFFLWRRHSCLPRRDSSRRLLRWNRIPVLCSSALLEPGIFGIFRPVLLLPEGIADHLTREQFEAILAHELCHVRRRDNLFAAMHMLVEAIFWFHPLVWWIGARLVEERERACDEEVLRQGNQPHVYAEGILKTCQFYLESPLACMSGVTGSNLKKRIVHIMTERRDSNLGRGRKLLLASLGAAALATPLVFGLMNPSQIQAQPQATSTAPVSFEVASIKPNRSKDQHLQIQFLPGGRFVAMNVPLNWVIAAAYNVPFFSARLSGGPAWIRSERYDIEAIAPKGAIPAGLPSEIVNEKIRSMLRALLADRFKLVVHTDTKELPVYALVVAKHGPKLQKAKIEETDCSTTLSRLAGKFENGNLSCHQFRGGQGRGLHGQAVDMSDLAFFISNWTDRPVINKTGIKGLFNIQTDGWVPLRPRPGPPPGAKPGAEDLALSDPGRPTLFMVLGKLGLKLQSQKAPIETFVIDHVERPSAN